MPALVCVLRVDMSGWVGGGGCRQAVEVRGQWDGKRSDGVAAQRHWGSKLHQCLQHTGTSQGSAHRGCDGAVVCVNG
jgi:hypothetical protein